MKKIRPAARPVIPPRTLRRIANILDAEAVVIGSSYGLVLNFQAPEDRAKNPAFAPGDRDKERLFREYRKLAVLLRAAAG